MYDAADPTGGAAGAGAPAAPSPSPSPSPSPAPPAPDPSGQPPAAAPTPKTYSYSEDRSRWVDPQRAGELVRQLQERDYRLAQLNRMIEAGTGFKMPQPPTAEDREREQVRNFFRQVMPELSILERLKPEIIDQLEDFLNNERPTLRTGMSQLYARDGHAVLDELDTAVAKVYGVDVDKLDPDTRNELTDQFIRWVEADPGRMALSNRRQGGVQLVDQFIKAWSARYVDPFRRAAAAPAVAQARANAGLPNPPKPSGMVAPGSAPRKPKTDDEVHDDAYRSFAAAMGGSR